MRIPESTTTAIWNRDGRRCTECGLPVARRKGLRPHTHHLIPRSAGGSDDPDNLITLCQPCHATRLNHEFMLARIKTEDYPQFVKWLLWETATNFLAVAESFDPRQPPSARNLTDHLLAWESILLRIRALAAEYDKEGIGNGDIRCPQTFDEECGQLEEVIASVKVAWQSHHMQRALDEIIRTSGHGQTGGSA